MTEARATLTTKTGSSATVAQPAAPVGIPKLSGAGTPTVPFPAGTTTASLPAREAGPVGSPRQWALPLLLTHDLQAFSSFESFYALDRALRPVFSPTGVNPAKSADDVLYDAGFALFSTDGSRGAKEAAARRVLANAVVEASLPLLRRFPDLPFVVLPGPASDSSSRTSSVAVSGPPTKRPRPATMSTPKKPAAASLQATRASPDTSSGTESASRPEEVSPSVARDELKDQEVEVVDSAGGGSTSRSRTTPAKTSSEALSVETYFGSVLTEDRPPVSNRELRRKLDVFLEIIQQGALDPVNMLNWLSDAIDRANGLNLSELGASMAHWRFCIRAMFSSASPDDLSSVYDALCTNMLPRVGGVDPALLQADRAAVRACPQLAGPKKSRSAKFAFQPFYRQSSLTAPQNPVGFQNAVQPVGYGKHLPQAALGTMSPASMMTQIGPAAPSGVPMRGGRGENTAGHHGPQQGHPLPTQGFGPARAPLKFFFKLLKYVDTAVNHYSSGMQW